ncbi:uncharacterized protein BDZ83DRAFT_274549 [Colletotrichum acutatum]|uniref:Uncharacterized protein n=1 Tax=Glomerella acutata TaxID=27357 RepID=A0AAD8UKH1_GLOAC|nr:uncharacterized protein BDZ83DRAFT_274549 [Colletotrichum acutatum]KAK1725972.1 hypothetical protein BDZ83DRAFT_274549 [Colletotrichum acutatum]
MLHTGVVDTGVLSLGIGGNKTQRTPPHTTRLGGREAGSTWIGLAWPACGMNPDATDPASVTLRLAGDGRFRSIRDSAANENGTAMRLKGPRPLPASLPGSLRPVSMRVSVFRTPLSVLMAKAAPMVTPARCLFGNLAVLSHRTAAPIPLGSASHKKSGVDGSVVWKLGWSTLAMWCGVQLAGLVGGGYSVLHLARLPVRQAIRDVLAWRDPM